MAVVRALKNPTLPIDLMCDRIAVNRRWILLRSGGEDYYLLLELGAQTVCTDAKSLAALPTETLGTPWPKSSGWAPTAKAASASSRPDAGLKELVW